MASDIDICNGALSVVGSNTTITSYNPPDGSAAAQYCATFFPLARRELLAVFEWSFARMRAQLTPVTNPSDGWAYAYALPAECLRPVRVASLSLAEVLLDWTDAAGSWGWRAGEAGSSDFILERQASQTILLTNEPDAVLFYITDQQNAGVFSPGFVTALTYLLASYLCGPIIRGVAGAQTSTVFRQRAVGSPGEGGLGGMAGGAAAIDANGSISERAEHTSASLLARA